MPSDGSHGILSPKSLAFFAASGSSVLLLFLQGSINYRQIKLFIFALFAACFLLAWLILGSIDIQQQGYWQSDQAKLFLITLAVPLMGIYLVNERLLSIQAIFQTVFAASFLHCSAKLIFVILHLLGVISIWDMMRFFGIRFMPMGIYGSLERMQTSVDIITPFIVFFVLQSRRLQVGCHRWLVGAYVVVSCLANFLSFSRLLFFVYGFSLVLSALSLPIKKLASLAMGCALVILIIFSYVGMGPIQEIVEQRLFSNDSYLSDETRWQQMSALWGEYESHLWFGKGMGGYVKDFIRDDQLPYSYEVQWLAFLMQFGLIGWLLIWTPLLFLAWRFISYPMTRTRLSFLALFGLWLLSGLTNPFLISLTSAVLYTLFYFAAELLQRRPSEFKLKSVSPT